MDTPERKPLALLIPGLDGTGRLYYRQIEPLSGRYRVRAWAFRPGVQFDFQKLVEELERATSGEEPRSILVVGESFGGIVAMHYVLQHPERVRTLVLINTFSHYRHRIRIRLACRIAPLLQLRGARRVKNFIVDRTLALEGIQVDDRRRYHEIIRLVDPDAYRRRLQLVGEVDLRQRLCQIAVPTLLFASGRDKLVPSMIEARFMASLIPKAQLHELPRAGHALLLTPGFSLADYV